MGAPRRGTPHYRMREKGNNNNKSESKRVDGLKCKCTHGVAPLYMPPSSGSCIVREGQAHFRPFHFAFRRWCAVAGTLATAVTYGLPLSRRRFDRGGWSG